MDSQAANVATGDTGRQRADRLAWSAPPGGPEQTEPIGPDASLMTVMRTTRAMRRLAPEPVPDGLLRTIVEAATWAPTGHNDQTQGFVVVTDRGQIARLAALWRRVVDDYQTATSALPGFGTAPGVAQMQAAIAHQRDHFTETPAVIVACYDLRPQRRASGGVRTRIATARALGLRRTLGLARAMSTWGQRSEAASIYPGVQNLLLAARAHGLAACLTTWHLLAESEFKAVLGIPGDVETFAVIPIGWPSGHFGPVGRRPVDEVIHRDRW